MRGSQVRGGSTGEDQWRYLTFRCVSFWKLAPISAIRPTAGTRRWASSSSAPATTSTSSISPRACRCCTSALEAVSQTVAKGGRILFVGTKRQAQDAIADAAKKSAQYYVNSRWLGGTLTNWKTISGSIARLRKLEEMLSSNEAGGYTKKERLDLQRERDKLDRSLGGIKDMGGLPDMLFVIDTNKEDIAIKEARRLNIPVAAIVDTNCDPEGINFPVPGNDDASRALTLYCDLIAKAAIDGISRSHGERGIDTGAAAEPIVEDLPKDESEFEVLPGPRGVADDLKKLAHVSPAIEKKLNDLGIFHYLADRRPQACRRRTRSARRSDCPAASKAGSRKPRPSPPKRNNSRRAEPSSARHSFSDGNRILHNG